MFYSIDKSKLYALIDEEVSKVADEAYAEGGQSLYDSIILTGKDRSTVERFMEDALNAFVAREDEICSYSPLEDETTGEVTPRISFNLPDMDSSRRSASQSELDRYVVMYVCQAIFQQRRADRVQEYATRMESSMAKALALLKKRVKRAIVPYGLTLDDVKDYIDFVDPVEYDHEPIENSVEELRKLIYAAL